MTRRRVLTAVGLIGVLIVLGCALHARAKRSEREWHVWSKGGILYRDWQFDENGKLNDHYPSKLESVRDMIGVTQIVWLDCAGDSFSDDDVDIILAFGELRKLKLAGSRITDKGLCRLSALQRLDEIDICDTETGVAGLRCLAASPMLRKVHVSRSQVTDIEIRELADRGLEIEVAPQPFTP